MRAFHGAPIDVPFYGRVDSPETAIECLEPHRTARTCAIYLNTPEQPHRPGDAAAVARGDRRVGQRRTVCGSSPTRSTRTWSTRARTPGRARSRPSAPSPRTRSPRAGRWPATAAATCVGPTTHMAELRKVGTHTFYAAPTASQLAVCNLLENPERSRAWLERAHAKLRRDGPLRRRAPRRSTAGRQHVPLRRRRALSRCARAPGIPARLRRARRVRGARPELRALSHARARLLHRGAARGDAARRSTCWRSCSDR